MAEEWEVGTAAKAGTNRLQLCPPQAKILAIGAGSILLSLVASLLESGMTHVHVRMTDPAPADRQRLRNMAERVRRTDPGAVIEEIVPEQEGTDSWRELVRPFHWILYVSQENRVEQLRALHSVCREEKKLFLPAVCIRQTGLAGPLIHPDSEICWETAWRRIHRSVFDTQPSAQACSSAAAAMLANALVFAMLQASDQTSGHIYILNLTTLEGEVHALLPHPLVSGRPAGVQVQHPEQRLQQNSVIRGEPSLWFSYFKRLTSAVTGIFHTWEEGDLRQLPLAQCRVRVADPLSVGPAELLPDIACAGFTHEEARREAGLAGMEAYASRMSDWIALPSPAGNGSRNEQDRRQEFIGFGAGVTFAEGVCRALRTCLAHELGKRSAHQSLAIREVRLHKIEDRRCRFYLMSLTILQGTPTVGLGENLSGFPVVWVGTDGGWHGCAGLTTTSALRAALLQALQQVQVAAAGGAAQAEAEEKNVREALESCKTPTDQAKPLFAEGLAPLVLDIPSMEEAGEADILRSAMQILELNRKRLFIYDIGLEPFGNDEPVQLFATLLREEELS